MNQYDIAYRDMCGASHGGFSTLWYVTAPTDDFPIQILVGYGPPTAKAIALALGSMFGLLRVAIDDDAGLRDRLDDLEKRYRVTYEERDHVESR